jgi:DNA repair protein RadA
MMNVTYALILENNILLDTMVYDQNNNVFNIKFEQRAMRNLRPERIECISKARGLDPMENLQNIQVAKPLDSVQHESCIEFACSSIRKSDSKIKLLIVDSMTAHYRVDYAGISRLPERQQKLNKYMHMLINTAQTRRVAVVVTNHQMYSSPDSIFDNRAIPIGGYIMSYASTYRIYLRRLSPGKFCATLDISSCNPQSDTDFTIDQRGVVDFSNGYDTQAPLKRRI